MAAREPWRPHMEPDREFNPYSATGDESDARARPDAIQDPAEDTAPLQGSKDLTDEDSLDDVIAAVNDRGDDLSDRELDE